MVRLIALILSAVFVPKLNFGIPGSHFAALELHFGGLGLPRGIPRGPLESKVDFEWMLEVSRLYLGTQFGSFLETNL